MNEDEAKMVWLPAEFATAEAARENEAFLDAVFEIASRWHAGKITSAQATAELRKLEASRDA